MKPQEHIPVNPRWTAVKEKLARSWRIIDLGCGSNPVNGACAAVDMHLDPKERLSGGGAMIDMEAMEKKGVRFINAPIDGPLPFEDKEFDFAYSHHVFEHVKDPAAACREMTRIAKAGAIITPSYFAEILFGRPYHSWLVMEREDLLLFFKKRAFEDRPFGESPKKDSQGKYVVDEKTNPFEILLNDEQWYKGNEDYERVSRVLRPHWQAHSPLLEVVFLWEHEFQWQVYD